MKRHPALRQLSSEHHAGLVLARKARQATEHPDGDPVSTWTHLLQRFRAEIEPHFRAEEEGLLNLMRQCGERELVERTLAEHRKLRSLIAEDRPDNLARFADLLSAHIRFEERVLFARAQQVIEPEQLSGLAD